MRIGYTTDSYPERRAFLNDNPHELVKLRHFNRYYIGAVKKRIPVVKKHSQTVFYEDVFPGKEVDGLHFFNSVTNARIPWISTYETCIPRLSRMSFLREDASAREQERDKKRAKKYVKLLASDHCKKIIALSKCNEAMQREFLSHFPEYEAAVSKKMVQLYPPQKALLTREEVEQKLINPKLKFLFVGKFFNFKGGNDIVDVFSKIARETDYPFEVLLVSLGDMNNHVFGPYADEEAYLQETRRKIDSCDNIELVSYVENEKLLGLMKEYDVGLLPTWGDTFGYSVLEMQAAGCPVISTNIRALDEINSDETGWKINLPVTRHKEVRVRSVEEKNSIRQGLQQDLERIVLDILARPEQIKEKRLKAYDRLCAQHSVETYYTELNKIYTEAFTESR